MYSSTILEALQEDADWDNISKKCDHIKLVHKLIKQTSSKYHPYLTIIEELMAIFWNTFKVTKRPLYITRGCQIEYHI